jgi:hypothetical protein
MAAAAAAAAAVLGLGLGGDEEDEEDVGSVENLGDPDDPAGWEEDLNHEDEDDPPLDDEAIEELKAQFRDSLI